jgi:hypothetical protein
MGFHPITGWFGINNIIGWGGFNFLLIFLGGRVMDIKATRFGYGWACVGFFSISRPTSVSSSPLHFVTFYYYTHSNKSEAPPQNPGKPPCCLSSSQFIDPREKGVSRQTPAQQRPLPWRCSRKERETRARVSDLMPAAMIKIYSKLFRSREGWDT